MGQNSGEGRQSLGETHRHLIECLPPPTYEGTPLEYEPLGRKYLGSESSGRGTHGTKTEFTHNDGSMSQTTLPPKEIPRPPQRETHVPGGQSLDWNQLHATQCKLQGNSRSV